MDSCGIIYVEDGADYLELACNSARSVRSSKPGLPVDLFCNLPPPPRAVRSGAPAAAARARAKLTSMQDSRFDARYIWIPIRWWSARSGIFGRCWIVLIAPWPMTCAGLGPGSGNRRRRSSLCLSTN